MKILKIEDYGIHPVYNTNVEDNHNYISKGNFINHNCVVDESYQGEVHVHLTKVSGAEVELNPGDKIVQFILVPVNYSMPEEVSIDELYEEESARGAGGFGSTGV